MLTMPGGHSERELELARAVARHLGAAELHVYWREGGPAPVAAAIEPAPPLARGLALLGTLVELAATALASRSAQRQ